MRTDLPAEVLTDLESIDLSFDSKHWDRRRRGQVREWAASFLERAAGYLIEDQMRPEREYWPGALDAVHLLREKVAAIEADEVLNQRAGRAAASWLPKYVLARQSRDKLSDA